MLNLETLQDELNASDKIIELFENYGGCVYICDAIMEQSDSNIDIYYYDLFEWAKHNFDEIEAANEELGCPNDIIKQIQQAQYLVNSRELYEELETGVLWAVYEAAKEYGEEITEEQAEKLEELANSIDNNSYFEEITDGVKEIFEPETDEE